MEQPHMLRFVWVYENESGEKIGEVKRFDEPDGKQVIPFFKREGNQWTKGGAEKPRPLFNLPRIINQQSVFLVEGERCAQALRYLGIPATTSVGGAGGAKHADWSPFKTVKRVFLLPDANEPGENYIEDAALLIQEHNKEVKFSVCRLPNLPDGGDIVDWIFATNLAPGWDGFDPIAEEHVEPIKKLLRETLQSLQKPFYPKKKESEKRESSSEEIRSALTFQSILSSYGKSATGNTRSNGFTRVSSPFASDSSPSFDYNEQTKCWHCFSSGKGGDVFDLIAELEGVSAKGSDFSRVLTVAENLTGLKRKSPAKSKVVNIATRMPADLDFVAEALVGIDKQITPDAALIACETILRKVAASNGDQDEFVLERIKNYFDFKTGLVRPFARRIKAYREELTEEPSKGDGKIHDAPKDLYLKLYAEFLGDIRRDIFSGELWYWNKTKKLWCPVKNELDYLRSRFREYGTKNDLRFYMDAVRDHLSEFKRDSAGEICLDVPKWDGISRIDKLAERIKLKPTVTNEGEITIDVLKQFLREWHVRMWKRLENPFLQNRIFVLKGGQGIGKDTWIDENVGGLGQWKVLFRTFRNEKDTYEQLHAGMVMHIEEFDKTARTEVALLKDILTTPATLIRSAYAQSAEYRRVRCSFIATCNVDDILRDYTGNRRYIVFEIEDIDRGALLTDEERMQVLAEGKELSEKDPSHWQADEQSEKIMKAYLKEWTPNDPANDAVELWDDYARAMVEDVERKNRNEPNEDRRIVIEHLKETNNGQFLGFLTNAHGGPIMERIGRDLGAKPRIIRSWLKKHGRGDQIKRFGMNVRGFYFGVNNEEIESNKSHSPTSVSDENLLSGTFGDIPF